MIEMLVVVAVIALLVALLLPALGKAREAARGAVCAAHQRQMAVAFLEYQSEFRGYWPTGCRRTSGQANYPNPLWSWVVARYLNLTYITETDPSKATDYSYHQGLSFGLSRATPNPVLNCPSSVYVNYVGNDPATDYGYNDSGIGSGGLGRNHGYTFSSNVNLRRYGLVHRDEVVRPHNTIVLGDWSRDGIGAGLWDGALDQLTTPIEVATYHAGAANILWADSHVSRQSPQTITHEHFDRAR